jgi:hypothetical protein
VAQLVEHGDADLLAEVVDVREVLLERPAVDRDPVREVAGTRAPPVRGIPSKRPYRSGSSPFSSSTTIATFRSPDASCGGSVSSAARTMSSNLIAR